MKKITTHLSNRTLWRLRMKVMAIALVSICFAMFVTWSYIYYNSSNLLQSKVISNYDSLASALASCIDGDEYAKIFASADPASERMYGQIATFLTRINARLGSEYMFTFHADPITGEVLYGFDTETVEHDSLSFTSEEFYFLLHYDDGKSVVTTDTGEFEDVSTVQVTTNDEKMHKLYLRRGPGGTVVMFDGDSLFTIVDRNPFRVLLPDGRILGYGTTTGKFSIDLNGVRVAAHLTLVKAGRTVSVPNSPYLDFPGTMSWLRGLALRKNDFTEHARLDNSYGSLYTFCSAILDSRGHPVGFLGFDIDLHSLDKYKNSLMGKLSIYFMAPIVLLAIFMTLVFEFFMLRPIDTIINDILVPVESFDRNAAKASSQPKFLSILGGVENEISSFAQKMNIAAYVDELTHCYNRRYLNEVVQREVDEFAKHLATIDDQQERERYCCGLLMIDLDHFKNVNDQYGHDVGDEVLKKMAAIVKKAVRQKDMLVRMGGEEFLVVAYDVERTQLPLVAGKIRRRIEQELVHKLPNGTEFSVTCSIGYAPYPLYTEEPEALSMQSCIRIADIGLYYSKEHGRNRCSGVEPLEMPGDLEEIEQLKNLDEAVDKGLFKLRGEF